MDTPTTTPPSEAAAPTTTGLAPTTKAEKVPVPMGIRFENIDQAYRFAANIADTDFVPKAYRKRPADILAAVQMGQELGLAPMQALSSLAVVNGYASLWGDGLLAVVISSPTYLKHDECFVVDNTRRKTLTADDLKKDTTAAVCVFWRHGRIDPVESIYSIGHAKKAGLWSKQGPWQTNPDRMLKMRARSFAARDMFPDVLRGIRTVEEVQDIPADDAPVVREVRRMSDTPADVVMSDAAAADVVSTPAPAPPTVVLDPAGVKAVAQFLGGYTVTLTNGIQVDVTEGMDALDLEKFVDTRTKVQLTVNRVADTLQLVSFAVVD